MDNSEKIGHFDWIASYEEIKPFLREPYLSQESLGLESLILVVGCGTSTFAESLTKDFDVKRVLAVDNDHGCIHHMKSITSGNVIYEHYDLIERQNNENSNSLMNVDEQFNIIFDKGTFDAILVEGSVVNLLEELVRLLRVKGKYFLLTINGKVTIEALFQHPCLLMEQRYCEELSSGTLFIFEKSRSGRCSAIELAEHERAIFHNAFKTESSLLTSEYKEALEKGFEQITTRLKSNQLDLLSAYHLMFDSKPELNYKVEMFLEDVKTFYQKDFFQLNDIFEFLKLVE